MTPSSPNTSTDAMPAPDPRWAAVAEAVVGLAPGVVRRVRVIRGERWALYEDPVTRRFVRLAPAADRLVRELDGQRAVGEAFARREAADDTELDTADAAGAVGFLQAQGLLRGRLAPDAAAALAAADRRRRARAAMSTLNVMFLRVHLVNPDRWLDRLTPALGAVFSRWGLLAWVALLLVGLGHLVANLDGLADAGRAALRADAGYLAATGAVFLGLKLLHELGHGVALKRFLPGGSVPSLGVMLLVFVPVPWVDATDAWAIRDRRRRIAVGGAGMFVELAVAAIAAILWARTAPGALHTACFQTFTLAGLGTLLFNANPLLRFDGYHMLADGLDTPNLAGRARGYALFLLKRFGFAARRVVNPSQTRGERGLLLTYAVAAWAYRLFISFAIVWLVAQRFYALGVLLAAASLVTFFGLPAWRGLRYLHRSEELAGVRGRAWTLTGGVLVPAALLLVFVPAPVRGRAHGLVDATNRTAVYAAEVGRVVRTLAPGSPVVGGQTVVLETVNPELAAELTAARSRAAAATARRDAARADAPALAAALHDHTAALQDHVADLEARVAALRVRAPADGTWILKRGDDHDGAFVGVSRPADADAALGTVADLRELRVRVACDQTLGPRVAHELGVGATVGVRLAGDAGATLHGTIIEVAPAGRRRLRSAALGLGAGGRIDAVPASADGTAADTAEPHFEVVVALPPGTTGRLNERAAVFFDLPAAPVATQAVRALRGLLLDRFAI